MEAFHGVGHRGRVRRSFFAAPNNIHRCHLLGAEDFSTWRKGKNSQMKGDRAQGKHLQAFHLRHLRSVIGFWKGKNHSDLLHPNSFVFAPFFFFAGSFAIHSSFLSSSIAVRTPSRGKLSKNKRDSIQPLGQRIFLLRNSICVFKGKENVGPNLLGNARGFCVENCEPTSRAYLHCGKWGIRFEKKN